MGSSLLTITVKNQNGVQVNMLSGEAEGIVLSTSSPGGCLECRFRLARSARLQYPDIRYPYEVLVSDNQGVFWRGRMERLRKVFDRQSEYLEITAMGGGVNADDQIITSETIALGTAVETGISTIRSTYMPKVTEASLVATGRTLNAATILSGVRAREAINQLARLGTSANAPLLWHVWPDGASNAYLLELVARPTAAGYTVDLHDIDMSFGFDGKAYANRVRISYTLAGVKTWRMVEDTTVQGSTGVNLIRELAIEAPDIINATDADNIANTALTQSKKLIAIAESAQIAAPWAVIDTNRQVVPLHRIRAGKLLYIQGLEASEGQSGVIDWGNALLIVRTSYDDDSGVLDLTFERFDTLLEGLIAMLVRRTEI